jgi:hypothetical protein
MGLMSLPAATSYLKLFSCALMCMLAICLHLLLSVGDKTDDLFQNLCFLIF